MFKRSMALLIVSVLLSGQIVVDQEPTPEPGDASELPPASLLGEGWTQYDVGGPEEMIGTPVFAGATDWIEDGTVGVYSGPNASRIVVAKLVVDQESFGVRQVWEDANNLFLMFALSVEPDRESLMSRTSGAPLAPCEDSERIGGTERLYHMPVGVTMCAQGESSIWIFLVSGTWNDVSGVDASDALTVAVLGG